MKGEVDGNYVILDLLPTVGVPAVLDIVNGMAKKPLNLPGKSPGYLSCLGCHQFQHFTWGFLKA